MDDSFYVTGGYDLYQVYIGEAFTGIGASSNPGGGCADNCALDHHGGDDDTHKALDGVYFHTTLFGDFDMRPPTAQEYRVVFSFTAPHGPISRYLATTDGKTFKTNFDALNAKFSGDHVDVERAFIALLGMKVELGETLTAFKVESFVDGELRDRAPGGVFVPGSNGMAEIPSESVVKSDKYPVVGPSKYFQATIEGSVDAYKATATSLLSKTSQHVRAELYDFDTTCTTMEGDVMQCTAPTRVAQGTWSIEPVGKTQTDLPAKGKASLEFKVIPRPLEDGTLAPVRLNIVSDAGGRVGFVLAIVDGQVAILPEGTQAEVGKLDVLTGNSTPFPNLLFLLAALGGVAWLRRPTS